MDMKTTRRELKDSGMGKEEMKNGRVRGEHEEDSGRREEDLMKTVAGEKRI
jgi:hypothetical protein